MGSGMPCRNSDSVVNVMQALDACPSFRLLEALSGSGTQQDSGNEIGDAAAEH